MVIDAPVDDVTGANTPINMRQPDGAHISSTHICSLKIPAKSKIGHIIPGLASHSLLSVVRLCNAGYKVTFTMIDCKVRYRRKVIIRGYKYTTNGLWMGNLQGWEGSRPIDQAHLSAIENVAQTLLMTLPNQHPLQGPLQMAANAL